MKKTLFSAAMLLAVASTQADTIAQWTFESSGLGSTTPSHLPGANASTTNFFAEGGIQAGIAAATGLHVTAATYTSPVGNGSTKSLSANNWSPGDYFQFQVSSVGFSDLSVSYDQTGSATGPGRFNFSYSTDGSLFTDIAVAYTVLQNGGTPNPAWNSGSSSSAYSFSYDLSSIVALDDAPTVYFRVVDANTISTSGGVVGTGGTDRIDNFTVTGVVPEPSTYALLGLGGLVALWRRRKA